METYSVKDIAILLDVNPETVRRWVRDGKLSGTKKSRKNGIVVTEHAFNDFKAKHPKYKSSDNSRQIAWQRYQGAQQLIQDHSKAIAEEEALVQMLQESIREHQKQIEKLKAIG